jgi:hypothetical protein
MIRKAFGISYLGPMVGGSFLFLCLFLGWVSRTSAIPYWSRKYETSCTTCHSDFPELNDFGLAFKKAGFRFPKDDDTFVKQPPIMLGAKAQKEAFPNAVWPGELPLTLPIAFRYSGFFTYNNKQPIGAVPPPAAATVVAPSNETSFVPRTDLFVPDTFTIISSGTFGPMISFWVDNDISAAGANAAAGLGDGYLKVMNLGKYIGLPPDALNFRMGQFEMDLPFTQARTINLTDYDIYDQASVAGMLGTANNPLMFSEPQRGIELSGVPNLGYLEYSVAFYDGNNSPPITTSSNSTAVRNYKDVYVRVAKRWNLDRDPAARKEVRAAGPTGPRDHTSIKIGGYYYYGRNALNDGRELYPTLGTFHEPFYRVGGDFRFKVHDKFELYGLGMYGHDVNHIVALDAAGAPTGVVFHDTPVTFSGGFVEAEYWFYPWIIGLMRYDAVNSPTDQLNGLSRYDTRNRFSPGVQILIRANIKWAFEYQYRWQVPVGGTSSQFYRPNGFLTGFDFAF